MSTPEKRSWLGVEANQIARLGDAVVLEIAIRSKDREGATGTERLLAQCVFDLMGDKERFRRLHRVVSHSLKETRPPEGSDFVIIDYGNGAEADPYSWLSALLSEADVDFMPDQPWSGVAEEDVEELLRLARERQATFSAEFDSSDTDS
jgi:hypothetical protein